MFLISCFIYIILRVFGVLFKSNSNGENKFEHFSQLTPAGQRLTFVLINLAIGGKPKHTLKLLKDHEIISESLYLINIYMLISVCYRLKCEWSRKPLILASNFKCLDSKHKQFRFFHMHIRPCEKKWNYWCFEFKTLKVWCQ